jgi:hypothetical protein
MVIALLLRNGRQGGVEIGRDHVGKNGARLGQVELDGREIHGDLSKLLVASQKLCVDGADLVERIAYSVQVADELSGAPNVGVAHVIPVGPPAGLTD